MDKRNWIVLLVGGSSGIGKTRLVRALSKLYDAKVIEADDICCAVKSMTTKASYPAIHYWISDIDWTSLGVEGNVEQLCKVSEELSPALKAIVDTHVNAKIPLIIEGDFISPKLGKNFNNSNVKVLYLYEGDEAQIVKNYTEREGGVAQNFRASISMNYGLKLKLECDKYGLKTIESRPWHSLLERVNSYIQK